MQIIKINKLYRLYLYSFFVIMALPILNWSPWFYPADWGKTIIFRSIMSVLLLIFTWQVMDRQIEINLSAIKKNIIAWSLGILFLVFLMACVFSVDPYFSFWGSPQRSGGFVNFAFYITFAILAFLTMKQEDWKKLWNFSISVGFLVCAVAFIQFFSLFSTVFTSTPNRPSATLGNPIFLGIYLLLLLFLACTLLLKEKNTYLKIFYSSSILAFLFTILITESRAAYLGAVAGICTFVFLRIKKSEWLKISISGLLVLAITAIVSIIIASQVSLFIQNHQTVRQITSRLSFELLLQEGRFPEWKIAIKGILEKPILGWGPENYAVPHDKYYDPKVSPSPWWDRAHNVFLDSTIQAGLVGLLAYLSLFLTLFWKLHKKKRTTVDEDAKIKISGIQSVLVGYLVANFFSFDSYETYLIFFLIVGYCLHLTLENETENSNVMHPLSLKKPLRLAATTVLFLIVAIFLWQYNLSPFITNAKINQANNLVTIQQCDQGFYIMDNHVLKEKNFLYAHSRMEYVEMTIKCNIFYPQNNSTYIHKGFEAISQAVEKRPSYTRYWLALGAYTGSLAAEEKDSEVKKNFIEKSKSYLAEARKLGPKQQDVVIEQAKTAMVEEDYKKMQEYARQCIDLDDRLGACFWYMALSKIYLGNTKEADKDIQTAFEKGYNIRDLKILHKLADAYVASGDWQKVISIYRQLIDTADYNNPQYHSSLAYAYKLAGDYANARKEALIVIQLSPESRENVEEFLRTLP